MCSVRSFASFLEILSSMFIQETVVDVTVRLNVTFDTGTI